MGFLVNTQPPAALRLCIWAAACLCLTAGVSQTALAQNTQYTSTSMWGSAPGGVGAPGALESASAHYFNGLTAGQVNAARNGMLMGGTSFSIQSIGSQNITTLTINGNHNDDIQVNSDQNSSNTGDTSTNAKIENDWN